MKILVHLWIIFFCLAGGCAAPKVKLPFPREALSRSERGIYYDVNGDGRADFALLFDGGGRVDRVAYDDREDGSWNRVYRLGDYANADVPHLILMLDSIPYEAVRQRWEAGDFRWFDRPTKVIPPFPSMTELIFTEIEHAPPMPGFIDRHYDRSLGRVRNLMLKRAFGWEYPWESYLDAKLTYFQYGMGYLHPREWCPVDFVETYKAFNANPRRTTLAYLGTPSAMLSRYGKEGLDESLDQFQQLCLQVLYDRCGAVKISAFADHGHNLMASKNVYLEPTLEAAGFHVTDKLRGPDDVYLMLDGLVTVMGINTDKPAKAADAVVGREEVQLAEYLDGERIVVENAAGRATVERRGESYRYTPAGADVLGYAKVLEAFKRNGQADAEGFVPEQIWFEATADEEYPDGPKRLWDALHGMVLHPADVLVTLKDGWCAGDRSYEKYIQMKSTHGGLNQVDSATFLLTMTGKVEKTLRSSDLLETVAPGYVAGPRGKKRE